jgi:hypothetical protein
MMRVMLLLWRVVPASIPMTSIEAGIDASDAKGHNNNERGTAAAQ